MLHVWCTYSAFQTITLHRMQINRKDRIISFLFNFS